MGAIGRADGGDKERNLGWQICVREVVWLSLEEHIIVT